MMQRVFPYGEVRCKICNEPTTGEYRRGENFYCADHFEKTSVQELIANNNWDIIRKRFRRFFANLPS